MSKEVKGRLAQVLVVIGFILSLIFYCKERISGDVFLQMKPMSQSERTNLLNSFRKNLSVLKDARKNPLAIRSGESNVCGYWGRITQLSDLKDRYIQSGIGNTQFYSEIVQTLSVVHDAAASVSYGMMEDGQRFNCYNYPESFSIEYFADIIEKSHLIGWKKVDLRRFYLNAVRGEVFLDKEIKFKEGNPEEIAKSYGLPYVPRISIEEILSHAMYNWGITIREAGYEDEDQDPQPEEPIVPAKPGGVYTSPVFLSSY